MSSTTSAAATVVSAAQKASSFANNTVETARFEALKEPLGFIKILQFIMAILAFAIAVNGGSIVQFSVSCPAPTTGSQMYQATYSYPYDITASKYTPVSISTCTGAVASAPISTNGYNIVSSAGFFVFTGVMAFLYSLAFTIIYVFFKHKYDNVVFLPLIDFGSTALFTLFWFAGSIAWAKAINDIQNATNPDTIIGNIGTCSSSTCSSVTYPSYGNLVVSCILGFGNLILWAGDCWFVLKETSWYKTRRQMQESARNVTNNPISSSNVNINVTAQYNPNSKI